jgi:tetratricopeptide (TPR) repeat protein
MLLRIVSAMALSLLAMGQAQAGAAAQPTTAPSADPGATVLVLPLENFSRDARFDWLGEGLAELTVERLTDEGRAVFSREEFHTTIERMGLPPSSRFTRATMLRIAEQLDADYVIFGSYTTDGKTLSVTLHLLRQTPPQLSAALTEAGALETLPDVHAALAWQVMHYLNPDIPYSKNSYAQRAPRRRLDAFEDYVHGVMSSDDEQSTRFWREAARLEPEWSEPAFALGQAYFAARKYAEANTWFGRVTPEQRHGLEAAFYDGVARLLRNDPARAEAAFSALLNLTRPMRPGSRSAAELPEALNNLGIALARQQKWQAAAESLQRATQIEPEEADTWFNFGLMALRADDGATAVRAFREARKRRPDDAQARALFILALEQSGRQSEAAAERENAPGGLPNYSLSTLAGLDRVRMKLELSPAAAALQGTLSPRRAQALRRYLARGNEYLAAEKWEEARREFAEAVLLAPDASEAHLGMAETCERLGQSDEALRELRASLWSHEDVATRVRLARLLMELKRPAEARTELRTALRLEPSPKLREEVRQLLITLDSKNDAGDRP